MRAGAFQRWAPTALRACAYVASMRAACAAQPHASRGVGSLRAAPARVASPAQKCNARAGMQRPRRNAEVVGHRRTARLCAKTGRGVWPFCARAALAPAGIARAGISRAGMRRSLEPGFQSLALGFSSLEPGSTSRGQALGSEPGGFFFFFFCSEIPLSLTQDTSWFFEHVLPSIYYMRDTGRKRPRAYCPGPCLLVIAAR